VLFETAIEDNENGQFFLCALLIRLAPPSL